MKPLGPRTLILSAIILSLATANVGHSEEPTGADYREVMRWPWLPHADVVVKAIATGRQVCRRGWMRSKLGAIQ